LRLVGSAVTKQQQIGGIVTMKLVFPSATIVPSGPVILAVSKGSQTKTYTLAEIKALTPITGYSGTKNKAGVITGPMPYRGVALTDLLSALGGIPVGGNVKFTAKDSYTKTLTYDQIMQGTFTTYDTTGNAVNPEMKLVVFVAYEADGKALDDSTGPVQLAIMTSKNQVTDGSNFVKQIEKIEVISAQ
jgi:DMSO/TMAO reductase YedYZ molybdopterin-dependent catalytic subunit